MTEHDHPTASQVYARHDPGVDPPTVAFGLDLERAMDEGDVVLFMDQESMPSCRFYLHRIRGAFRISLSSKAPWGVFGSAQAALREGWAAADVSAMEQRNDDFPSIDALLNFVDRTRGII